MGLQIIDYTSFSSMKKRSELTMGKDFENHIDKNVLKETGGFFRKGLFTFKAGLNSLASF